MKKLALALSTGLMVISLSAPAANAQTMGSEAAAHPRIVRAIEVLEKTNTPEGRQILESLAKGAGGALQTREAQAALARMTK